jgi:hypothetical protein
MYQWTEPYGDEYIKERIEELQQAQQAATDHGCMLVSAYEQFWLPVLNQMPDTEYVGSQSYRAPYGTFEPAPGSPFHGALWFSPEKAAELPAVLKNIKEWVAAEAALDLNARMVKIQAGELEITFTGIDISRTARQLLEDVNEQLVRTNAGIYVWRITPLDEISSVHHLFPDGRIPTLTNAHTRADVTGYAVLEDRPYQHMLVYIGIAAHKTSVESLWASLIRGRGACSMRGTSVLTDGEIKMLTQPLPEFNVLHAGLICRKALPGKWEAKDDAVYALVFDSEKDVDTELQIVTLRRLQEVVAFPIPDEWSRTIWEYALDAGFIQRLVTGGDCPGGVRIDLTKPWQEFIQNLLEQSVLTIQENPYVPVR